MEFNRVFGSVYHELSCREVRASALTWRASACVGSFPRVRQIEAVAGSKLQDSPTHQVMPFRYRLQDPLSSQYLWTALNRKRAIYDAFLLIISKRQVWTSRKLSKHAKPGFVNKTYHCSGQVSSVALRMRAPRE